MKSQQVISVQSWLKRNVGAFAASLAFGAAPCGTAASAQPILEEDLRITCDDAQADRRFGESVAIDGNYMIVGVRDDRDMGAYAGAAYVFDTTTGQQLYKLYADDADSGDQFGYSVDISGNLAIIGSPNDDDNGSNSGSAYIFNVATGEQVRKLLADVYSPIDSFGYAVAIDGGTAVVGVQAKVAYVFSVASGTLHHKLRSDNPSLSDRFGWAVACEGNLVAVGAHYDSTNGSTAGAVHVFDLASGERLHKLLAEDGSPDDYLGNSVAIQSGILLAGARSGSGNNGDSGAAYLFDLSTGQQLHKLIASDGFWADHFGDSVALNDRFALVGAPEEDHNGTGSGSAYLFDIATGQELFKLAATDGQAFDGLGDAVALGESFALVGAPDDGDFVGSVYRFVLPSPPTCPADTNGDGTLSPADFSAWIAAFNTQAPACDQNADGLCTAADFSAWVANYNAGCP